MTKTYRVCKIPSSVGDVWIALVTDTGSRGEVKLAQMESENVYRATWKVGELTPGTYTQLVITHDGVEHTVPLMMSAVVTGGSNVNVTVPFIPDGNLW
jgi:hypothetical protein